jgi:hypothetical protein
MITRRIVAMVAAIFIVAALLTFGPSACTSLFTAKKEARLAKGQAKASLEAGAEAMSTVSNTVAAEKAADQEFEEIRDEIRKAPEAERSARTLDASCGLRHNQHKQRCAGLPKAGPAEPARSR